MNAATLTRSTVRALRLWGFDLVEQEIARGSLADALRAAVEAEEQDARSTVRPGAAS